jgi:catechol 2,3-dioxygenase-like lactoylglutathione lyase family enzyme
MKLYKLDHVQLAMPPGQEAAAREFYGGVLGLPETAKPRQLVGRGGVWFQQDDLKVHLGVEQEFRPAAKAHPAFLVHGLAELVERCRLAGHTVSADVALDGYQRVHVNDPFGNRIELMEVQETHDATATNESESEGEVDA